MPKKRKPGPQTYHGIALSVLALIVLVYYVSLFIVSGREKYNFLYSDAVNLDRHVITTSDQVPAEAALKKIIFLGGSSISGNNIPVGTTISDYFNGYLKKSRSYNLGTMQATIITELIYLQLVARHNPSWIIYGVSPDDFPLDEFDSPIILQYRGFLHGLVPETVETELERVAQYKKPYLEIANSFLGFSTPTPLHLAVYSWLEEMRLKIYGRLYAQATHYCPEGKINEALAPENITLPLIGTLRDLAEKQGAKFFVFLNPLLTESKRAHDEFRTRMTAILDEKKIKYADFSELLPESHDYFLDFIHLTPEGNKKLAESIFRVLGGVLGEQP